MHFARQTPSRQSARAFTAARTLPRSDLDGQQASGFTVGARKRFGKRQYQGAARVPCRPLLYSLHVMATAKVCLRVDQHRVPA